MCYNTRILWYCCSKGMEDTNMKFPSFFFLCCCLAQNVTSVYDQGYQVVFQKQRKKRIAKSTIYHGAAFSFTFSLSPLCTVQSVYFSRENKDHYKPPKHWTNNCWINVKSSWKSVWNLKFAMSVGDWSLLSSLDIYYGILSAVSQTIES